MDNAQANITQLVDQAAQTGAIVVLSSILPAGEITLARQPLWSDKIDAAGGRDECTSKIFKQIWLRSAKSGVFITAKYNRAELK